MSTHVEDEKLRILTGSYELFVPEGEIAELDLGCGTGAFSVELARRYPERSIYAADVMLGRLRKLVRRADRAGTKNLTVLRVEARMLVGRMLPDGSIDRIHLLCPDPWPKGRHRGHRLLSSDFCARLHRVLKPEGIFHFSSDDAYYCDAVGREMSASKLFAPAPEGVADLAEVKSDFERRWEAEGKQVVHRAWRRLPLPPKTIGH